MLTDEEKEEIEAGFKTIFKDGRFMNELTGRDNPLKICAWFFDKIEKAREAERERIKGFIIAKYYVELQGDEYPSDPSGNQLIEAICADIDAPVVFTPEKEVEPREDGLPF